jgi:hypothetical protein
MMTFRSNGKQLSPLVKKMFYPKFYDFNLMLRTVRRRQPKNIHHSRA